MLSLSTPPSVPLCSLDMDAGSYWSAEVTVVYLVVTDYLILTLPTAVSGFRYYSIGNLILAYMLGVLCPRESLKPFDICSYC